MRLYDFFDYHVRERPDSEFAFMDGRTVTYSEASKQINRLANAFASSGIKKGDRVAFLSKNRTALIRIYVLCRRQVRRGSGTAKLSS